MTSYQAPTEDLREFNNAVFKDANSATITLAQANALYLARTGVASSTASSTTFSGSIVTSANISVNGLTVGQSSVGINNTLLGISAGSAINNSAAVNDTLIGHSAGLAITTGYANSLVGSSAGSSITTGHSNSALGILSLQSMTSGTLNTAVGFTSGTGITNGTTITAIGANTSPGNNSGATCLGASSSCSGANATAIGKSATAGANQISLGTNAEYVTCKGNNLANGYLSLVLDSGLRLQTSYTLPPSAAMLGYRLTGSTAGITFITGVGTGTANITTIPLPSGGVWSIDYSVELTVITSGLTASIQSLYCSLTTNGTFAQRISNSGIIRTHSSIVYASGDNPVLSGSFIYYVQTATTIYPVFSVTTTAGTGSMTGSGFYTATRVG
jgi:hypothetical protein